MLKTHQELAAVVYRFLIVRLREVRQREVVTNVMMQKVDLTAVDQIALKWKRAVECDTHVKSLILHRDTVVKIATGLVVTMSAMMDVVTRVVLTATENPFQTEYLSDEKIRT